MNFSISSEPGWTDFEFRVPETRRQLVRRPRRCRTCRIFRGQKFGDTKPASSWTCSKKYKGFESRTFWTIFIDFCLSSCRHETKKHPTEMLAASGRWAVRWWTRCRLPPRVALPSFSDSKIRIVQRWEKPHILSTTAAWEPSWNHAEGPRFPSLLTARSPRLDYCSW